MTHAVSLSMPPLSTGSIEQYIHAVNQVPMLSEEQELLLARRFRESADLEAARLMVMSHLRLVVSIARNYLGYGLPHADLIQEGSVGLMKAVKRFDPDRGVRLASLAIHWIKAEIHEYILRNWRLVRIATTKAQRKLFFNLRSSKKRLGWLSNDEADAVAEDLGVDVKVVQQMEGRMASYDMAFDADNDSDDEAAYKAPAYFLEDQSSDLALQIEEEEWEETTNNSLYLAMEGLDERSKDILASRWLSDDKATLHELADKYGISAERVRQLEKNAMNKIKGKMVA